MDEIKNYFSKGILFQTFEAKRNIFIWKKIADEYNFLSRQNEEVVALYSFVQKSAWTNVVLHTAKIYDKPSKKYPTICILSFLELIKNKANAFPEIIETPSTIKTLKSFETSQTLIDAVKSLDLSSFPLEFYNYYKAKYDSPDIQTKIDTLKFTRDKIIAHNEALQKESETTFQIVSDLLVFAEEIISVFAMAYLDGTIYRVELDAERNAYFITANINSLKKIT